MGRRACGLRTFLQTLLNLLCLLDSGAEDAIHNWIVSALMRLPESIRSAVLFRRKLGGPYGVPGVGPLHPAADVTVGMRPEHNVKMIRHQAECQNPHRAGAFVGLVKQVHEGLVIRVFMKHPLTSIPAVEDVVAATSRRRATRPGRAPILAQCRLHGQQ